jgi:hypothetical protein
MPISLPQKASLAAHRLPQRTILACTRPVLVGHAVELATAQPPPTTTAKSKPKPPLAQHREPVMDAAGDHADPGHPSHRAVCPPPRPGPHSGRTQRTRQRTDTGRPHRTPTPDPGQRTPGRSDGTGHWTPIAGTGKRGHWTLAPDTGHWTLAEDADRVTTARSASGPPGPPCRATARWGAQPCSCGRRLGALLSSDDYGSSVKRTAKLHPL